MKKNVLFLIVLILIVIAWQAYRTLKTSEEKYSETSSDSKIISKDSNAPLSLKLITVANHNPSIQKNNDKGHLTDDDQFLAFDKVEEEWVGKVEEILGVDQFSKYLEMKKNNDIEKMQAYKEYHDYLRQKYGDKFSYNISDDQSPKEKQINQRYLKDLLKLIGPIKFKSYTSAKDQLNEQVRRSNKEAILIEF